MCGQLKYPVRAVIKCSLNDNMDDELEQNPDNLPMAATEAGFSPVPHFLPLQLSYLLMDTFARSCARPCGCTTTTPDSSRGPPAICTESTNRRSESNLIKALLHSAKGYINTQAIISRSSHFAEREGSSTACLLEQKQLGNPITLISSCLSCPNKNTS